MLLVGISLVKSIKTLLCDHKFVLKKLGHEARFDHKHRGYFIFNLFQSRGMNMNTNMSKSKSALMASCSVAAMALTVSLPSVASAQIDEIIVTSQKRAESIQDVPIAMSAFDEALMKQLGLGNVKDLIKFTPGFAGNSKDSFLDFVNVRGISTNDYGNGGDPSVGFFKNGLYQGRTGSAVTSLYDMERAEVLRGPQGFLFGRNAISGAISFYTRKPNFDGESGHVDIGVGERGLVELEGAANMPLSDNFAIRIAGMRSDEDGFVTNTYMPDAEPMGGHSNEAARITAAMRGDSWDATFMVEYEDKTTAGTLYRGLEGGDSEYLLDEWGFVGSEMDYYRAIFGSDVGPRPNKRTVHNNQDLGNYDHAEITAYSAEINIDLDFATLTSLTGFKDHNYQYAEDYDGISVALFDYAQDQEGDYFEQELRLVSNSEGPIHWYAGVSYFKENIDTTFTNLTGEDALCGYYYYAIYPGEGISSCQGLYDYWYGEGVSDFPYTEGGQSEKNRLVGKYKGWGAYADVTFDVGEQIDLGIGLRYSRNTKTFSNHIFEVDTWGGPWVNFGYISDGFVTDEESWENVTPRFIARYHPNDDTMIYGSITKGWKSGGFNSFGLTLGTDGAEGDGLVDSANYDLTVTSSAVPESFKPETVWSYEVGMKGDSANNLVRYDVSAYRYEYEDLQLGHWDNGPRVSNVGKVKAYGLEGTVQAVLGDHFNILLSASYNHNEITGADLISEGSDGNRLSGTPEYKTAGVINYHTPFGETGEVIASIDFVNQTDAFIGIGNASDEVTKGWSDVSVRVGYEDDDGWSMIAYVENLFDEEYFDAGYEADGFFTPVAFGVSRPQTMGVRFHMNFGE